MLSSEGYFCRVFRAASHLTQVKHFSDYLTIRTTRRTTGGRGGADAALMTMLKRQIQMQPERRIPAHEFFSLVHEGFWSLLNLGLGWGL